LDLGVDGKIILKWVLSKQGVREWNGFKLLRTGSSGGFLRTRQLIFVFHKRWGIL